MRTGHIKEYIRRAASLVLALAVSAAAGIRVSAAQPKQSTVRIPYGYNDFLKVDENGSVSGYYAEFFEQLAKINNWHYEYVKTSWHGAVEMLENGDIDLIYPTNCTEEREKVMDFSAVPTGYISSGIFALKDSEFKFDGFESFDGARIALDIDSSNGYELREFAKAHDFTYEGINCPTIDEIIELLKNGGADLGVFNAASTFDGGILVSVMEAQPAYIAVRKGNSELLSVINSSMQKLIREYPDLVSKTLRKTLVGDNGGIFAFTEEERAFADSKEEITVGYYESSEPLAFTDENGDGCGIYVDLLLYLREKSGLNFSPYPITGDRNWMDMVKSGEIDFFIGTPYITAAEYDEICVTDPFMEYTDILVTRNDNKFKHINVPVIAVTYGQYDTKDHLENILEKPVELKLYHTAKECMLAVVNKEADGSVINNMEFNYQIKNDRLASLIQWPQYHSPVQIGLAASRSIDRIEFSAVNKAIKFADADHLDAICDEWLNMPYHSYSVEDYIYNSRYLLIIIGLVILGCVIIAVIVWVFRSRQSTLKALAHERERTQLGILAALSRDYSAIYYIDLDKDLCETVRISEKRAYMVFKESKRYTALREYVQLRVLPEYLDIILPLCDPNAIIERFKKEKSIFVRYQVIPDGNSKSFYEMHYVDVSEDEREHRMVLGFRCVDDIVKEEQRQRRDLRDALSNANRANAAKSDFLSMMSHDIRTPMNAIIGMTAIARSHAEEPDRVRDALDKIASSGQYLLRLVNDVLDMSKIESGKFDLTQEDIDLKELLSNLLEMIRSRIEEHHQKLSVDIANIRHEAVIGDTLRLQQMFMNLMSNAIKYTPDGGEISFTVNEKPVHKQGMGCYEFVFADNGAGMSKEFQEHIFEPFRREEDLRVSKIQGTGLGLPITKNIVQLMNGNIIVDSAPGKGSVFTVTVFLKLRSPDEEPDTSSGKPGELNTESFEGHRILLVEDNDLNREIAKEILEMSELTVDEAEDGRIAVDMFSSSEEGYYDMVIMDIQMPGMNGYDATRAIRGLNRSDVKSVPIIAMTANAFVEDIQESRAAGMNEHLSKPIDFEMLNKILRKYLTR